MKIISKYLTVKNESRGIYKEKGSKFIGIAVACYNESDAKEKLAEWKKEHHQARHLCYAYRFGVAKTDYRVNDDGEPNNSAGQPIFGQIESFDLTNILIGVVRYYGGTKLGVGGLINAYRTAAKEALTDAEIVMLEVYQWVELSFEYEDLPSVMNVLKKYNLTMHSNFFEESCKLTTNLNLNSAGNVKNELEQYTTLAIRELGIY